MIIRRFKLLLVGPVTKSLSAVGLDFYHMTVNLRNLGSFRLEPLKRSADNKIEKRKYIPWHQTQGAKAVNSSEIVSSLWTACRFVVASSGDLCLVGSWVFATSPFNVRRFRSSLYCPYTFHHTAHTVHYWAHCWNCGRSRRQTRCRCTWRLWSPSYSTWNLRNAYVSSTSWRNGLCRYTLCRTHIPNVSISMMHSK